MPAKLACFIQPNSGEPIYQQLTRQLKHAVASGSLRPGDQLPTVRDLAEQLVINPNTVARSYRELIALGVLEGTPGSGTFVKASSSPMKSQEREQQIRPLVDQLIIEANLLGLGKRELLKLVQQGIQDHEQRMHDRDDRAYERVR